MCPKVISVDRKIKERIGKSTDINMTTAQISKFYCKLATLNDLHYINYYQLLDSLEHKIGLQSSNICIYLINVCVCIYMGNCYYCSHSVLIILRHFVTNSGRRILQNDLTWPFTINQKILCKLGHFIEAGLHIQTHILNKNKQ